MNVQELLSVLVGDGIFGVLVARGEGKKRRKEVSELSRKRGEMVESSHEAPSSIQPFPHS